MDYATKLSENALNHDKANDVPELSHNWTKFIHEIRKYSTEINMKICLTLNQKFNFQRQRFGINSENLQMEHKFEVVISRRLKNYIFFQKWNKVARNIQIILISFYQNVFPTIFKNVSPLHQNIVVMLSLNSKNKYSCISINKQSFRNEELKSHVAQIT